MDAVSQTYVKWRLSTVKPRCYGHRWNQKVSVLRTVLIKRVNFKETVLGETKKTVRNNECP